MKIAKTLQLRRVRYKDDQNTYYEFLTNIFEIEVEEVAFPYTKRWGIELFKKMKQNFQLHCFYGENVNAIYTRVWCTLIAQLFMTVIQKMSQAKKAFSVVASLVCAHLISLLDVYELLSSTRRAYDKKTESPPSLQPCLNL
jgi:IS4 transposase